MIAYKTTVKVRRKTKSIGVLFISFKSSAPYDKNYVVMPDDCPYLSPPRSNVSGSFSLYFERFYSQLSINMSKDIYATAVECKFFLICLKHTGFLTFKYSSPGQNGGDKSKFPLFSNQLEHF